MANFFNDFNDNYDDELLLAQKTARVVQTPSTENTEQWTTPENITEEVSPEAYLNDYRNRMPFHYIETGTDGYYFWQYGATMGIEFEITDEVAITDPTLQLYPIEGAVAGSVSLVNPTTHIIELGTMATASVSGYYTLSQTNELVAIAISEVRSAAETAKLAAVKIEKDLYSTEGPEYLNTRLVAGENILIERDTTDVATPKLKISTINGAGGVVNHNLLKNLDYTTSGHTGFASEVNLLKLEKAIPTRTSQIVNDTYLVEDANYVHTDNNFTNTQRDKLSTLNNYDDTALVNTLTTELQKKQDKTIKLLESVVTSERLDEAVINIEDRLPITLQTKDYVTVQYCQGGELACVQIPSESTSLPIGTQVTISRYGENILDMTEMEPGTYDDNGVKVDSSYGYIRCKNLIRYTGQDIHFRSNAKFNIEFDIYTPDKQILRMQWMLGTSTSNVSLDVGRYIKDGYFSFAVTFYDELIKDRWLVISDTNMPTKSIPYEVAHFTATVGGPPIYIPQLEGTNRFISDVFQLPIQVKTKHATTEYVEDKLSYMQSRKTANIYPLYGNTVEYILTDLKNNKIEKSGYAQVDINKVITVDNNGYLVPKKPIASIDNLTSTDILNPLSANMGKELKAMVDLKASIDLLNIEIQARIDNDTATLTAANNYSNAKIQALGDIFVLRGSVQTITNLPTAGNKDGDVWFVISESVGYLWILVDGVYRWEKFGAEVDLTAYLTKTEASSIYVALTTYNSFIASTNLALAGKEPNFSKNTAFNKTFEDVADNIKMDNVAAVGISNNIPRADHTHPSDTSKATVAALGAETTARTTADTTLQNNKADKVDVQTSLDLKLDKISCQYNKELALLDSGLLFIGSFPVYDTNITIDISSTTNITYNARLIIAFQNHCITSAMTYGDSTNSITSSIYIKPSNSSDIFVDIYFIPQLWSKNIVEIRGSAVRGVPTHICELVQVLPTTATLQPTNSLNLKANIDSPTFVGSVVVPNATNSNQAVNLSQIPTTLPASDVKEWAKAATKPVYTAAEVGALSSSTVVPTKTSQLTNDSSFATTSNVATSLTQAKDYTDNEIAKFDFIKVVASLPITGLPNKIYMVAKASPQTQDLFDEYIWNVDKWELVGTKVLQVDLTLYALKSEVDTALLAKQNSQDSSLTTTAKTVSGAINELVSKALTAEQMTKLASLLESFTVSGTEVNFNKKLSAPSFNDTTVR